MADKAARRGYQRPLFLTILLLVTAGLAYLALLLPELIPYSSDTLQVGQVAPQDILAPQDITYQSEILTALQQEAAALAVPDIFTNPNTAIARQQLERLRSSLAFITSVRNDGFSSQEQKLTDLAALEDIHLKPETATSLLIIGDSRWQAIQQEAIVVLEQVMRGTIRENRLEEVRRSIPTLVSLSLPEDQTAIVAELVSAFVVPNSLYSDELTEAAREKARTDVQPVIRNFKVGEAVVSRGTVITATDLEALQNLGLAQTQLIWQDFARAAMLVILTITFLFFYIRRKQSLREDMRSLTLIALLFLTFLVTARVIIPGHVLLPYIFPLSAFGLTVSILFGTEVALLLALPLAILASYGLPNALQLILFYLFTSLLGILALGRARRLTAFFWAGAAVAFSGAVTAVAYYLGETNADLLGLTSLAGAALLNGIASAGVTVALHYFLAQFLGLTTALQLVEISRPDHPLLQMVLRNAPGTYQHSLQVANLAEQAAEAIDADPLLTRVGALYHDIGKAINPIFFIENQLPGSTNPHDQLEPYTSSEIIIQHVYEGLDLARKYRLPRRIQDFIDEHHGTMITRYQYVKAVEAGGGNENQVEKERFRYPGSRPSSRETAIVMLADGCEARVRAERPKDQTELREIVKSVIQNRVTLGELDNTNLTLRDLDIIADSFTATLRGMYHPRIEYPKLDEKPVEGEEIDFSREDAPLSSEIPTVTRSETSSATPQQT